MDRVTGYRVGPVLAADEPPWPTGWEQDPRIDDGHAHEWETCLLAPGHGRQRMEEVVRCAVCHAPRCSHSGDENPCMERRHHRGIHTYLDGSYEPVGGYLRPEASDDN
jgi:hypothetical protein